MSTSWPTSTTYTDPAIAFDPDAPHPLVYAAHISTVTVDQVRPVPASLRELAAPLTLGETLTARFHTDLLGDAGQPGWVQAELDPEANHGYTRASFHLYRYVPRGFTVHVAARPGEAYAADLTTCPKCASPWARVTQEAWGNATDCESTDGGCGYHNFYSIGD